MDTDEREYADANGTAWCSVCRRQVAIADSYDTDSGDQFDRVLAYRAEPLYCGHSNNGPAEVVGRASDDTAASEALAQDATRRRLDRTAAAQ